jgi:glycerol-1-phosphate dehydrogenase [NAD(P)+]
MIVRPTIILEGGAHARLPAYLADHGIRRVALVADANTYAALGRRVEAMLTGNDLDVCTILLHGPEVIVDEQQVIDVMLRNDDRDRAFLAVGSGTVTDIVRFVTLQTGGQFFSAPTAPSVDGYTSPITPMVIKRLKITAPGHLPEAIFADLDTLRAAPRSMIAAGVGDVIAKWTSTADWKLGALLWGDRYDGEISRRFSLAAQRVAGAADGIAAGSEEGIRVLMEGLIESGLCMADFGTSFPASGSEHLLSHFWESRLLVEQRPALLHGAKVGVGTVLAAEYWQRVRNLDRSAAAERLAGSVLPGRTEETERIRAGWPFAVTQVLDAQSRFLAMTAQDHAALKKTILEHWDEIQAIAATVPLPAEVAEVLRKVGGPTTAQEAGLQPRDLADGLEYAYYLRDRLPVLRLRRMLGV